MLVLFFYCSAGFEYFNIVSGDLDLFVIVQYCTTRFEYLIELNIFDIVLIDYICLILF